MGELGTDRDNIRELAEGPQSQRADASGVGLKGEHQQVGHEPQVVLHLHAVLMIENIARRLRQALDLQVHLLP